MEFWGADTDQLRQLSTRGTEAIASLTERRTEVRAMVHGVAWHGADAEDLRQRWTGLESTWTALEQRAHELCAQITAHAEAQDVASSPGGGASRAASGAAASAAGDTTPWAGEHERSTGPETERPDDLLGPHLPGGPRRAAAAPAMWAPDPDDPGSRAGGGSGVPESGLRRKDDPSDEFAHTRTGEETGKTSESVESGGVRAEHSTQNGAETTTTTLSDKVTWTTSTPPGRGAAEASVSHEVSDTYSVTTNPDGTRTYTFTEKQETSTATEAHGRGKQVDVFAGSGSATGHTYTKEVTVPAGVTPEQAAAMDPQRPESMPKGSSIKYTEDDHSSTSGHAGAGAGGKNVLDFSGSQTQTDRHATVYSRDEAGDYAIDTGDADVIEDKYATRFGTETANATFGNSRTSSHGTTDHVEFTADQAGTNAYREAAATSTMPGPDADGVSERWRDTRTATDDTHVKELHLGKVTRSSETNLATDELIVRDYLDGDVQYARQVQPHGAGTPDYVLETGGVGRPTEYEVRMSAPAGDSAENDALTDHWGVQDPSEPTAIRFTQEEAEQLTANGNGRASSDYQSPTDYFSRVSTEEGGSGDHKGWDTVYQDADGRVDEHGQYAGDQTHEAPGEVVQPSL